MIWCIEHSWTSWAVEVVAAFAVAVSIEIGFKNYKHNPEALPGCNQHETLAWFHMVLPYSHSLPMVCVCVSHVLFQRLFIFLLVPRFSLNLSPRVFLFLPMFCFPCFSMFPKFVCPIFPVFFFAFFRAISCYNLRMSFPWCFTVCFPQGSWFSAIGPCFFPAWGVPES